MSRSAVADVSVQMDDPLLTVREAATYLRFRESFIRRLIAERRIPYQKVAGFHVRIHRSSLDALIDTVEARRPSFPEHIRVVPEPEAKATRHDSARELTASPGAPPLE